MRGGLPPEGALDREGLALGVEALGVGEAAWKREGGRSRKEGRKGGELCFFFKEREERKIEVEVEFFFFLFFFLPRQRGARENESIRIFFSKFYYGLTRFCAFCGSQAFSLAGEKKIVFKRRLIPSSLRASTWPIGSLSSFSAPRSQSQRPIEVNKRRIASNARAPGGHEIGHVGDGDQVGSERTRKKKLDVFRIPFLGLAALASLLTPRA